ncbi:MAG: dihydroorotase [Chloroflexota bacterium]|nr:dihydroorotase [Chloroflexota bacterium]
MDVSGYVLIKSGRLIDPGQDWDFVADILIKNGVIIASGCKIDEESLEDGFKLIDASGLMVSPGFIDIHAHLREPGFEYKETIASGTKAAAKGGFTTVSCMPNTDPPIDNAAVVNFIHERARTEGLVRVLPIGCVTRGRAGKELADMEEMASAGVVAFSDDGDPVYDPVLMQLALSYSGDLNLPISNHCQDHSLSRGGVMAEGAVATRLGLPGIPSAAEEAMISRDIALASITGGRLHVAHLSTAGSVALVRSALEQGIPVTAEVCPHHLSITDQWVFGTKGVDTEVASPFSYDTSTKVYPPLRSDQDVEALIQGLASGVIPCIATDHAPHDLASKQVTYEDASFGISVFETALGSLMELVHGGRLSLSTLVERLTSGPAQVLGSKFHKFATLAMNTPGDLVIFDPNKEWIVDTNEFASKGKNTPLVGSKLKGKVMGTIFDGEIVFQDSEFLEKVEEVG